MSKLLSISLFFLLVSGSLFAQIIPFKNYSVKEGLPHKNVEDILQDNNGYLWFATQLGVSKFNGKDFVNLRIEDGLSSNSVECIIQDKKGRMWFGTQAGVSLYHNQKFTNFDKSNGLVSNAIDQLLEDNDGNIWCQTKEGISIVKEDTVISFTANNGLTNKVVTTMLLRKNGEVWVGTASGISVFANDTIIQIDKVDGLNNTIVFDLMEGTNGNVWIATQGGGVFIFNNGHMENINTQHGLSSNIILKIYMDKAGFVWCGTFQNGINLIYNKQVLSTFENTIISEETVNQIFEDKKGRIWFNSFDGNGIFKYENESFVNYNTDNKLVGNIVRKMYGDSFGNIWIGTLEGVSKYGKIIFENFGIEDRLPTNKVFSVLVDNEGSTWAGTYKGLLSIKPNMEKRIYNSSNGLPDEGIMSIYQDNKNRIMVGTFKGPYLYKNGKFEQLENESWYASEGIFDVNAIYDIVQDKIGNTWFATENGLIKLTNNTTCELFDESKGLVSNNLHALAIDRQNNIWCATYEGVSKFNPINESFINFTVDNGLSHNTCSDIALDNKGRIWVSTDMGLSSFIPEGNDQYAIQKYQKNTGLTSNNVFSILFDKKDNLWIGHELGLDRLNLKTGNITYYGPLDGFYPMENNEGAVDIDPEGNIYFGTVDGLVKYIPKNDIKSSMEPYIYITNVEILGDDVITKDFADSINPETNLPVNLKLPYNHNYLKFSYIGIHYVNPEKIKYKYILEGFDRYWSNTTSETSVTYQNLPHGKYSFKVMSCNSDGVWNTKPATYNYIIIDPPIWKRPWFYALEIAFGILLLYLFIFFRERKLRIDKKILAQKVKERTLEIEKQKDQIEEQNKEITDSIQYAKRIQSAVLPDPVFINQVLPEHFILFKPRDIVSGDFYWLGKKENKTVFVAADCTGHGVPGAFMSMLGVSLLNEIINNNQYVQADTILNELRDDVKKTLSQKGRDNESKDGMDLALCIIDSDLEQIDYAGAYNPLIQIKNGEIIEHKADKMPIGIHVGEERPFSKVEIKMDKGDCFYMFSDGYADQFGGPDGKKFRVRPFKNLLLSISGKPMAEQQKILDDNIEKWRGNQEQIDDMLVVGFRV